MAKHLLTLHEVRGLLALLGIVLHCAAIFAFTGNPLVPRTDHFFFTSITNLIHSFRMEAFFMIGGLAIAMLSSRDSDAMTLLSSRSRRLAGPMLWTLILLNLPILLIAMSLGQAPIVNESSALSLIELLEFHLWFLRDLIGFTVIYCLGSYVLLGHQSSKKGHEPKPCASSQYWMLIVPIMLSLPLILGKFFPRLHNPFPVLDSAMHWLHFGSYFALGICIFKRAEWLRVVATVSTHRLFIALMICLLYWTLKFILPIDSNNFLKFGLACFENANTLAMSYVCVHAASVLNRKLEWAFPGWSRSSYSIYLTHYPIICLLAMGSQRLNVDAITEFTLLLLSATLLTYWVCQHFLPRMETFTNYMQRDFARQTRPIETVK